MLYIADEATHPIEWDKPKPKPDSDPKDTQPRRMPVHPDGDG